VGFAAGDGVTEGLVLTAQRLRFAGWNTIDVRGREHRVVFASRVIAGVGLI